MPVGEFDYAKVLTPVFLSLFNQSQALLKRFNPCNVCDGVCERHRRGKGTNFCCSGCAYLGAEGCQVKALQCALWICDYTLIHESNQKAWNSMMWGIMLDAEKFHLLVPRGGMEDSIAQACKYYIEHREERESLMKAAKEYKPRPCFYPPPAQSSEFVRRWSSAPTRSSSVIPSRMTGTWAPNLASGGAVKSSYPTQESAKETATPKLTKEFSAETALGSAIMRDKFFQ